MIVARVAIDYFPRPRQRFRGVVAGLSAAVVSAA